MKNLLTLLANQLPSSKIHGLGSTALLITLALLGYYEYTGDGESAKTVLVALIALLVPAPLHTRGEAETVTSEPEA